MNEIDSTNILLQLNDTSIGYSNHRSKNNVLLEELNLSLTKGQLVALIGPNGCGKSTLIKTISGIIPSLRGTIYIKGENVKNITASEKSEVMGVVLTESIYEKNITIFEIVALGRYHYTNWFGKIEDHDHDIILEAIQKVGLEKKLHNRIQELSDGERQRAMIAKVLAQDAELIILDEPTAHLDLSNRMELLILLKELAHSMGKGILLSTHELSLALQVSDSVWIVNEKQQLEQFMPEELIFSNKLNLTFGNKHINFHPLSATFELTPDKDFKIFVNGGDLMASCVIRLIKRLGIEVVFNEEDADMVIFTDEHNKIYRVKYKDEMKFQSLTDLHKYLSGIFAPNKISVNE